MAIFHKEKVGNRRICYLFGVKFFTYKRGGGNRNVSARDFIAFYARDYFSVCDYC